MTIVATCRCGASFAANPQIAGTTVGCPQCGQPLVVPAAAPQPIQAPIPVAQPSPPVAQQSPPPPPSPPPSEPSAAAGSVLKLLLIIGGSVGGFLVLCIVLVSTLGKSNKAEEELEFGTGNSNTKSVAGAGNKKPEKSLMDGIFGKATKEIAKSTKGKIPVKGLDDAIEKAAKQLPNKLFDATLGKDEDEHFPAVAKKIGLNFMAPNVYQIHHIRLADALKKGFPFKFPPNIFDPFKSALGITKSNVDFVTIGVWKRLDEGPMLLVVKTLSQVNQKQILASTKSLGTKTRNGKTYHQLSDGRALAFLSGELILYGSENELVYGLANGQRTQRYRGLDWIDFPAFHSVTAQRRWGFNLIGTQYRASAVRVAATRQQRVEMVRHQRKLVAQSIHEQQQRLFALLSGTRSPRYSDFPNLALIRDKVKREQQFQKFAKSLERQREVHQRIYKNIDVSARLQGQVVQIVHTDRSGEQDYFVTQNARFLYHFQRQLTVTQQQQNSSRAKRDKERMAEYAKKFESKQFKDARERERLRHRIASEIATGRNTARNVPALLKTATETGDWLLRAKTLAELAKVFDATAVQALAKLAGWINLERAIGLQGDLSQAAQNKKARRYSGRVSKNIDLKILEHYLHFGADDEMIIATCRVLEDLRVSKSRQSLERVVKDKNQSSRVRQAASRAIKAIADGKAARDESRPVAKSFDEAVEFIESGNRVKIQEGLKWLGQAPPQGDRLAIVTLAAKHLDEEVTQSSAIAALKQWTSPKESKVLVQLVLDGQRPNSYRFVAMKYERTINAVIAVLLKAKDLEGLLTLMNCPDQNSSRVALAALLKLNTPIKSIVAQMVVDAEVRSRRYSVVENLNDLLTRRQVDGQMKEVIRRTAKSLAQVVRGTSTRKAWQAYFRASNFTKDNLDELIQLRVEEDVKEANQILQKFAADVEPESLALPVA